MHAYASTDLAITIADKAGSLSLIEREGRFGQFVAICDEAGTIEVADTMGEAEARVRDVRISGLVKARMNALSVGDADAWHEADRALSAELAAARAELKLGYRDDPILTVAA